MRSVQERKADRGRAVFVPSGREGGREGVGVRGLRSLRSVLPTGQRVPSPSTLPRIRSPPEGCVWKLETEPWEGRLGQGGGLG